MLVHSAGRHVGFSGALDTCLSPLLSLLVLALPGIPYREERGELSCGFAVILSSYCQEACCRSTFVEGVRAVN